MRLHDLKPNPGAKKRRKRVGRGPGSGRGKTSTRGHKGQGSRAGSSTRATFEGGQMPYIRRLPKRGFSNSHTRVEYHAVNLSDLERSFDAGAKVDVESVIAAGLANGPGQVLVKILAKGELTKKLSVTAHKFSGAAKAAIEKAGGSCTELTAPEPETAKAEETSPESTEDAETAEDNSGEDSAE
jgi:large subunit ribosomal protein L15